MKDKDIFEQFIENTGIKKDQVIDYRFCNKIYGVPYIENAIVIQLKKNNSRLIYIANERDIK